MQSRRPHVSTRRKEKFVQSALQPVDELRNRTTRSLKPSYQPSGRFLLEDLPQTGMKKRANVLIAKAITTVYRRMLFLVYPLKSRTIPHFRSTLAMKFSVLTSGDIDAYRRFRPNTPLAELHARFARHDRCFASWYQGEIVDAGWVAANSVYVPYLERFLLLEPGDLCHYDSYTNPAFRGRGLFMARNSFTAECNQSEGFLRSIALVAVENRASWRVLLKSGLETRGLYTYLRLGPVRHHWSTGVDGEELPRLGRVRRIGNASTFAEQRA